MELAKPRKISQPLTPELEETIRLRLAGEPVATMAEKLGCSWRTVYDRLAKPEVKEVLAAYQEERLNEAAAILHRAAAPAAQRLVTLMEGKPQDGALRAAVAILDRAGMGPTSKHEVAGMAAQPPVVLTPEEFEAERARLLAELAQARA